MNTIYTKIAAVALAMPIMLTGCVEETFPTSGVTSEQVGSNSKGVDAIVQGMPAYMKTYHTWNTNAYNFGYPSIFLKMNVQTQDVIQVPNGYDWFSFWGEVALPLNSGYILSQDNWYYMNFMVRAANDVITAIGTEPSENFQKDALAQAYIYRASTYLDMARIYEFLENETISGVNEDGNDVTGLTVPVTTPDMSEADLANNPRLPHAKMSEFLLADLQRAVDLYTETGGAPSAKTYPSLAVAYGLMARVYMWDENYPKAAEFAKKAYQLAGTPLSQSEWLSTTSGFNDSSASAWMWAIQYESNDAPVGSSDNWLSFVSPETNIGYGGRLGAYFMIDKSLYDKISDADFRKYTFKAPAGSPLAGKEAVLNKAKYDDLETYAAFKFRPGQGNMSEPTTAYAVAVPLMRVEEMYFIEAEALAHSSASEGKAAIESFMKQYRYGTYVCNAASTEAVVEEIILQKRIEFWGEGIIFFDFKRLNMGVNRAYKGSNWPDTQRYVTVGRPGWMNWPFVDYEGEFNLGVRGYLNPNVGEQFDTVMNVD